ncbi:unnamed protein product [Ectocarpus sp. CCAP 1310/34]|nr:unnamed protein product [Ectocarpus sp. CCAP 1310/34]
MYSASILKPALPLHHCVLRLQPLVRGFRGGYGVPKVPADVALSLTLWGPSTPTTLVGDRLFWGMSETLICEVDAILPKIDTFCEAIHAKGAPLPRCWRIYYDGWKRVHALKYQAVDSPDGIIRQLWGPTLGQQSFNDELGEPCYVYGDPAYQASPWLMAPFRGVKTALEEAFNAKMSAVRVSVEWGFWRVVAL